jgi:putative transposase
LNEGKSPSPKDPQPHFNAAVAISCVRPQQRSATERPSKNVQTKSGLNRSILNQDWFEFRRQFDYKLVWRSDKLTVVLVQNSSRTRPIYGYI